MTAIQFRDWRTAHGWTQREAALRLGTTKTTVYRWEASGDKSFAAPVPQTVEILCHLLCEKRNIRNVELLLQHAIDI